MSYTGSVNHFLEYVVSYRAPSTLRFVRVDAADSSKRRAPQYIARALFYFAGPPRRSRCQELAIRAFRYAIQLEPNFPDAYNNLGNALRESGQLEVGKRGTDPLPVRLFTARLPCNPLPALKTVVLFFRAFFAPFKRGCRGRRSLTPQGLQSRVGHNWGTYHLEL